MGKIKTTIELQDKMSQVINKINSNLNSMLLTMQNTSDAVGSGFDPSTADNFRNSILNCQSGMKVLDDTLNKVGDSDAFEKLSTSSIAFGSAIGNIITDIGKMALNGITDFVKGSLDEFNESQRAYYQLAGVLNKTSSNAREDFDIIQKKAEEISSKGMFDDDAMIAAAAEFATYFSDSNATASMMDTLSNYAIGMSQGQQVDSKAMVDYATNIAKLTTGAYVAMRERGFEVTEAQKAILKGTATHSQLVQELGTKYNEMTEDMQKATVINSIIEESWGNMYETMSKTPEGQIQMLLNKFHDFQKTIGASISAGIQPFVDIINQNMPTITIIVENFSKAIRLVMYSLTQLADIVFAVARVIIDNWSWISPIIIGVVGAFLAYQAVTAITSIAITAATIAQNIFNASLYSCPITWIIALVIVLIGVLYLLADLFGKVTGTANTGIGVIIGALNAVKQVFINVFETVKSVFENIFIFFHNKIADIQGFFWGLLATVVDVVSNIAEKLNALPFVNIDVAGLNAKSDEFKAKQEAAINSKQEYKDVLAPWKNNSIGNAYDAGVKIGDSFADKVSDKLSSITQLPVNDPSSLFNSKMNEIADDTSSISESLGNDEELEYLKDLAQQDTINRFTTAEIRVDMGGVSQNISKDTDADGVVDYLVNALEKSMSAVAEGVY